MNRPIIVGSDKNFRPGISFNGATGAATHQVLYRDPTTISIAANPNLSVLFV